MERLILATAFASIIAAILISRAAFAAPVHAYGGTERFAGVIGGLALGLVAGTLTSLLVGSLAPLAIAAITVPFACLAAVVVNYRAAELRGYFVNAVAGAFPRLLFAYMSSGNSFSADALVITLTLAAFGALAGIGYRVGVKLHRFHSEPAFPIY